LIGAVLVLTAAGCEVVTAGGNLLARTASPAVTVPLSDAESVPDMAMLVHGRWCGPGYPTEEEKVSGVDLTPVDPLDAVCMKHDLCYESYDGRPTCRCDQELIWRIKYLQYHVPDLSDDARAKTFLVLGWFETSACSPETSPGAAPARGLSQSILPAPLSLTEMTHPHP
jgi:hypothetical protein